MKKLLSILLLFVSFQALAGVDPKLLIRDLNKKFNQVSDYKADLYMEFNLPGVKMNNLKGKVVFKKPNKFKIKAKGIFFLPKQNPMQNMSEMLIDTNSYTSIISGYETVEGKNCAIVNIIPLKAQDELILGKFWIDIKNPLVYKSQITTKNNGTIETKSIYGNQIKYALPEKIIVKLEINRIKVPKMMSVDLNKKSKPKTGIESKETGSIQLNFSNYSINANLSDAEFVD
jgi:outer membrane lipoprotein-sorting protein